MTANGGGSMVDKAASRLPVVLVSFGFKHGMPGGSHSIQDVRFLPNPYWVESLRPLSGRAGAVSDYVLGGGAGARFLALFEPLLKFMLEETAAAGRDEFRLAVGCTGGRHRSVAVVEALGRALAGDEAIDLTIIHRDIDKA